ncbi:kelch domain-containing protein 2-like [Alligator mississippiensis]|uniref:Kelch domain-containing protein 2-like n=1 Tax=Alligator mississippiensis TaxID=8496 RepID=A0A151MXJ0_ALLMI|nr:kelch domain-containing protein 2-like [Alligator mississippiensis]
MLPTKSSFSFCLLLLQGKTPSPRAAHACATVGNRGYVFGGRYRDSRMNDLYYLNLDTWEWNETITQGICPVGRSWHSLTPISSDHLFLFGGFTTDKQPLSK